MNKNLGSQVDLLQNCNYNIPTLNRIVMSSQLNKRNKLFDTPITEIGKKIGGKSSRLNIEKYFLGL
jgi:hypothetical protein